MENIAPAGEEMPAEAAATAADSIAFKARVFDLLDRNTGMIAVMQNGDNDPGGRQEVSRRRR